MPLSLQVQFPVLSFLVLESLVLVFVLGPRFLVSIPAIPLFLSSPFQRLFFLLISLASFYFPLLFPPLSIFSYFLPRCI